MITGPVIFALTSLILLAIIVIIAMIRYPPEHALKVWAIVGPMLGSTIGGGGAYFFAQNSVAQVKDVANAQVASLAQAVSTGIIVLNKDKEELTQDKVELVKEVTILKEQNNELLANNLRPRFNGFNGFNDVMGSGMPSAPIKTQIDTPLFLPSVPQQ